MKLVTMTRQEKVYELAEFWYDANMTDKHYMMEYMMSGHAIPDYTLMDDKEIDEMYEEYFG